MSKRLLLTFLNEEGGKVTITVDNPKDNLTEQEVSQAMADLITKNIFTSRGGNFVEAIGAKVVTQDSIL